MVNIIIISIVRVNIVVADAGYGDVIVVAISTTINTPGYENHSN